MSVETLGVGLSNVETKPQLKWIVLSNTFVDRYYTDLVEGVDVPGGVLIKSQIMGVHDGLSTSITFVPGTTVEAILGSERSV